jgi:hypothetical protein
MEHTKGPWKFNGHVEDLNFTKLDGYFGFTSMIETPTRLRIDVWGHMTGAEETKKTAELIAAAPELLETLNQVLANTAWQNIGITALDKALKLINRLEGTNFSVDSLKAKK